MKTLSIERSLNNRPIQKLKIALGRLMSLISPRRAKELFENPTCQPKGIKDKAIMAFLKHRAAVKDETEFLNRLHKDVWKSEEGVSFARNCDIRFEEMSLKMQQEEFEFAIKLCNEIKPFQAVEIGCSSGPVLNYLTQSINSIENAVGIDINEEQIAKNKASDDFDPRISFLAGDGFQWVLENSKPNTLFITNGGVLEYFPRERLNEMLTHISTNLRGSVFFAVEPIADDHDWTNCTESIPFGDELSFSHNYWDAFEGNGFDILHQRPVVYERWKMMATIAKANLTV